MIPTINKTGLLCLLTCWLLCLGLTAGAQCYNGDAEANNFSNWTGWTGTNNKGSVTLSKMAPGIVPGRHTIMTAGSDPVLLPYGVNLPTVSEGSYSIRLGNAGTGKEAEVIAYTFVPTSTTFSFSYAMVMQSPWTDHDASEMPFFSYLMYLGAPTTSISLTRVLAGKMFVSSPFDPFFESRDVSGNTIVFKRWQTECINIPSRAVGQTVTLYFVNADCFKGGHFGYAYIDGLCKGNLAVPDFNYPPTVCSPDELWVDGSLSKNARDHFWKIEHLSSPSITSVIPGTAVQETYNNQPPKYEANLLRKAGFRSHTYPTGYYKLTLGVRSCSGGWAEKSVVVRIDMPSIVAEEWNFRCCPDALFPRLSATVSVVDLANPGSFHWFDQAGTSLGTGSVILNQNGGTLTSFITLAMVKDGSYKVEYTNSSGCKSEKWVNVVNRRDFAPYIENNSGFCEDPTKLSVMATYLNTPCSAPGTLANIWLYIASVLGPYTYSWSTGETTQEIDIKPGIRNYTVTMTNGCYTHSASINLDTLRQRELRGPINRPMIFTPNTMIPARGSDYEFIISDSRMLWGEGPAYNADYYLLRVYARNGQMMYEKSETTKKGFKNGIIRWDGTYKGKLCESNTYTYYVIFKNCDKVENLIKGDVTLLR